MNNPKLYTVKEAAKLVGVSSNTLYKYLDDGRIHAARGTALQGRFRIPQSALEEFLGISLSSEGNAQSPAEPVMTGEVRSSKGQTLSDSESLTSPSFDSLSSPIVRSTPHLPTAVARFLLVLALIAFLADLFISASVSLPVQLTRLFLLLVMLLLAYSEGGYRKG